MKRAIIFTLFIIATCGFAFAQDTQKTALTENEKEAMKLEREWLNAYEEYNPDEMERIMADDFVITYPNGRQQDKKQIVAMIKAIRASSQQQKMRLYTENVQSRIYGDTVVLMGIVVTEFEKDGKNIKEQSRYTDTYVKRNGRWQVAISHLSNVEEKKSTPAK